MDVAKLEGLAPSKLTNQSSSRYAQVHDAFDQAHLTEEAKNQLRRLYSTLGELEKARSYDSLWDKIDLAQVAKDVGKLGATLLDLAPARRKAIHDIRGGAIFGILALGKSDIEEILELDALRLLAYDHAKLIRGLFPFLDPIRSREEEQSIQVHTLETYLRPWRSRVLAPRGNPVQVKVSNDFEGAITCRCVETSALDRTLFNLANNAARFTQDSTIELVVFQSAPELIRWCVINTISEEQEEWLRDKLENNGRKLFQGGMTRGGTGIGLESCADVMARVFGLPEKDRLISRGYIGATLVEGKFCAWFHWPRYHPLESDSYCECATRS